MISAVCGRAPPPIWPAWASLVPPLLAVICQDWLSVMKTRAFCASEVGVFAAAGISNNDRTARWITDRISSSKKHDRGGSVYSCRGGQDGIVTVVPVQKERKGNGWQKPQQAGTLRQ